MKKKMCLLGGCACKTVSMGVSNGGEINIVILTPCSVIHQERHIDVIPVLQLYLHQIYIRVQNKDLIIPGGLIKPV